MSRRRRRAGRAPVAVLAMLAIAAVAGCGVGARNAHGAGNAAHSPVWLRELQMVTATAGWAVRYTRDPNGAAPAGLALARTTDAGRTWRDVTPAAVTPLLRNGAGYLTLLARTPQRAWLAVTNDKSPAGDSAAPHLTIVFATADGGRAWTRSQPIRAPGNARLLSFADPAHGWLVLDLGAAMMRDRVQVYRTADGGLRWSLVAQTPALLAPGAGASGIPVSCDKTTITFATAASGWLTGTCALGEQFLASRDGGRTWREQALPPLPCAPAGCTVAQPQFFGATGFVTAGSYPGPGVLLVSHDAGATWRRVALPRGAGAYPAARFFGARSGVLVAGGPQGSVGRVFYATSDGGRTWRAVPGPAWPAGIQVQFVSTQRGFAWDPNARPPVMYATVNGGRSWSRFLPLR